MEKLPESLSQLNEKIAKTERTLEILYKQRRELINYLNLNKGTNNAKESISRRGSIESPSDSST